MVEIPEGEWTRPLEIKQSYEMVFKEKEYLAVLAIEEERVPWFYDIMKFLILGIYPNGAGKKECHLVWITEMQYILFGGQHYRRSYDGVHLRCLKKEEAEKIMEEVDQGVCGPYMNGRMLAKKNFRMGRYWNTMETNCVDFVKRCHDCKIHENLNHVPPSELYSMTSPWPFSI